MKLGIMQPYFFPYIGYYQLVNAVDEFIFLDDVNFINKGWINRNNILVSGKATLFTVPLSGASQNILISDINHAMTDKWREGFLKTLTFNYKKSPRYTPVYDMIREVLYTGDEKIGEVAKKSVTSIFSYLGISKKFTHSSAVYSKNGLNGEERILDICKATGCTHYYNPIGGVELYSKAKFVQQGIELKFVKAGISLYQQPAVNEFVPGLSMIDVLFNNTAEKIKEMFNQYTLVDNG